MPPTNNLPAGYVLDTSRLTANPLGQGTYKMVGPDGQALQVPFSKVRGAEDYHYQLVGNASDASSDAGRYQKDAAAVAPTLLHSLESSFGVSPAQRKAAELDAQQHPRETVLEADSPGYAIAKGLVQQARGSYSDIRQAVKDYHGGNSAQAVVDAVHAIPILGRGLITAAGEAPKSTGNYLHDVYNVAHSGPAMGTLIGTSIQAGLALDGAASAAKGGGLSRLAEEPADAEGAESSAGARSATDGAGEAPATPPPDASAVQEPGSGGPQDAGNGGEANTGPETPPANEASANEPTNESPQGSESNKDGGEDSDGSTTPQESDAGPAASPVTEPTPATPPVDDAPQDSADSEPAPDAGTAFSAPF